MRQRVQRILTRVTVCGFALAVPGIGMASVSGPQCEWTKVDEFGATIPQENSFFGFAFAQDGDRVIVGAPGMDGGALYAGSAYSLRFDGSQWVQEQKLLPADPAAYRRFGTPWIWRRTARSSARAG